MMRKQVKQTIFDIKPYIPGKPIEEVKREMRLKQVIKLASNENSFGPSAKVYKALEDCFKNIHRYPDSQCYYLREVLAKHLKVKEKNLTFGNGSDELIVLCARLFVKPADEVVVTKPSFLIYEIASKIEGAIVKTVPLSDFRYDLKRIKEAAGPKTKIIFLGNPDNPAGSYLTHQQLTEFLQDIPKHVLVFLDEAYYEYVDEDNYADSIKLLSEYKNLFISRTFSKMYALAGLRIGYGIASEELIGWVNRIREPFNINVLAQRAAMAAIKDQKYYKQLAKNIKQQRQFLYDQLKKLKLDFVLSFTNFILIRSGKRTLEIVRWLLKRGVIVRDMNAWGMPEYFRVTIGTQQENKKFIKTLEAVLC